MPAIKLCFLWHMHQPFYKNLSTGEYRLPWTRLHGLKDYYGMVKILESFPAVHQTFNLVPSLLIQIEEYASGRAVDPFLEVALKPAEALDRVQKEFLLRYFFQANEEHLIGRYPRYAELFEVMKQHENSPERAATAFDVPMLRDLQVLSQLAWFDEEHLRNDADVARLVRKQRAYSAADQALIGAKETELLGKIIPAYRAAAERQQIEISVSPFYHPIVPLLCDSNIAQVAHPYLPLPTHFAFPSDAEEQMRKAIEYVQSRLGITPEGLWPPEGSVSDDTLDVAAKVGFRWTASDDGVLEKTLDSGATAESAYRPYTWRRNGRELKIVFRDHRLSDLIGFGYAHLGPKRAANHFMRELRRNCAPILRSGDDAMVAIILDGENAWESYRENGRPFLRELYRQISEAQDISALTLSEALAETPSTELTHVFPGSWIDTTFDIWIGAKEDNCAWEQLLRARQAYDAVLASPAAASISEENKRLALEELFIAEGSDWCWWYGPEHSSANKPEFDQLFRDHLMNVYRLLGLKIPPDLKETNIDKSEGTLHDPPSGLIQPTIDGQTSRASEWSNAGRYRVDLRSGAMHSRRPLLQELRYGSDGQNIYFSLDLAKPEQGSTPLDLRLTLKNPAGEEFRIDFFATDSAFSLTESDLPENAVSAGLANRWDVRVSMSALHIRRGEPLFFKVNVFRDGVPVAALPARGELQLMPTPMAAGLY